MSSNSIEFRNVSKQYRLGMTRRSIPAMVSSWSKSLFDRSQARQNTSQNYWALDNVSFELKKGDTLALVGANGAGKSTILKLIAQITRPTSGEIKVNGKLSALIELGAGFHPDLSGRENIFLNGAILGLKRKEIQRRFDSIVEFSELERFIDTPVKRYSSGMAVRLGFAVAASIDPDVLLVDEVLAVGDTSFRLKCMTRIQELIDNGTTLIFVSHNMGQLKAICDSALYIEKGVVKLFGETERVIDAYNTDLNQRRISEYKGHAHPQKNMFQGIVAITRVDVQAETPGEQDSLNGDQPASITVHYQSKEEIAEAALVLRIIRTDGVLCCAIYSKVDQIPIRLEEGAGKICLTLQPLQLYPGTYYVAATLKNQAETVAFDLAYSEWFQVQGAGMGFEDLGAVFEPNRLWNSEPEAQPAIHRTGAES